MKKTRHGTTYVRDITEGCRLCFKGAKLVLFVTGLCTKDCWYCPISPEKYKKDVVFANERPVKSDQDIIAEAREMSAEGAGITGGEPLLKIDRCAHYIKLLKKEFGPKFHIHLYTYGDLATTENIRKLEGAGLDEIRFHLFGNFERILPALKSKIKTGVEIPALPENKAEILKLIDFLGQHGVAFLNLNEFEFSDRNYEELAKRGHKQVHDLTYATRGSREFAEEIMQYAEKNTKLAVHFCPVQLKSRVQLTNRLKRRAKNLKRDFEKITPDGLIKKGIVEGSAAKLKQISKDKNLFYNPGKNRIETTIPKAKEIAKSHNLQAFELLEYPIWKPWDFEKNPLP